MTRWMRYAARVAAGVTVAGVLSVTMSGCARWSGGLPAARDAGPAGMYRVEIVRTRDGIPHLRASDWGSLGFGEGYAQAQDDLCTLADGFLTYRGERSAYFGPDERPATAASFGQPRNLDADFFFRLVEDASAVARYRAAQPPRVQALVDGFAAGYDRYLDVWRAGHDTRAHAACRGAPWVGRITRDDVYRRLIAATLAGGAGHFLTQIARAQPPDASSDALRVSGLPLASAAPFEIGGRRGIGSNALAFGASVTQNRASLLFGNPHWFWSGPDRFYQSQLTIPGQLDVAGVAMLGVPVVMIGFNQDVAWTHTVSSARRFGIFQLSLVPGQPTRYFYDGQVQAMTPVVLTVQARGPDGRLHAVTRTLYRSRFGPLLDLSTLSPALGWNAQHAFALRDVNADNPRVFANFLEWNTASSLDDFIGIQRRLLATPWVNTFAIGRGDPRVWFADIGAMPNVSDALAQRCAVPLGRAFDAQAPGVPFLDGSTSACEWQRAAGVPQPGILPAAQMPWLLRTDYVGNFNGSYWLTHPGAPLTGFAAVAGQTGVPQSLRTRLGHQLAEALQQAPGGVTRDALEARVLGSESMSAQLLRQPVLDSLCSGASEQPLWVDLPAAVAAPGAGHAGGSGQTERIDLREACRVLRRWDGTARPAARGANLWDAFWRHASAAPAVQLWRLPFDPGTPLTTPSGLDSDDPAVVQALRQALGSAVRDLRQAGAALDAPRGALLYAWRGGVQVPLYGGCDADGYFTVVCTDRPLGADGGDMDRNGFGDSYLQVVGFGAHGVEADTLLAPGESDDPAGAHDADSLQGFARGQWQRFPFTPEEIARDAHATRTVLTGESAH